MEKLEPLLWKDVAGSIRESEYENKNIQLQLREAISKSGRKLIVLDDDPTGVQAVHGISVYTDWEYDSVLQGFLEEAPMFFLLTNSRSMTKEQTIQVHREIAQNILRAAAHTGKEFLIISRGDSTLRGHYPLEQEILKEELEKNSELKVDGEILIPYFQAGGRYTIDNIHYVKYGKELIPAANTEFAADKTFGYTKSDLREYIEEKTEGAYPAQQVKVIGLDELREADIDRIESTLTSVTNFDKLVVNAIEPVDLEVFSVALYQALQKGKYYLLRTAADFVRAVGGISQRELLKKEDLLVGVEHRGGIVVIGSHTSKTTAQLEQLKNIDQLVFLEFQSDLVLEDKLDEEVERVTSLSSQWIDQGKTVVVYTSRRLLTLEDDTKEKALLRSVKISEAVQQLVAGLSVVPKFVVAKGGITSSDIGVKALRVKKAYVLGQIQPGVPVWKTDDSSRFPGIPYIIFPGNVGENDTLKKVVLELV